MTSKASDEGMANHVASSTAVQGHTHRVVGMERVELGGLTCLYKEKYREMTTFAQKVVGIGAPGLLAKWTGL